MNRKETWKRAKYFHLKLIIVNYKALFCIEFAEQNYYFFSGISKRATYHKRSISKFITFVLLHLPLLMSSSLLVYFSSFDCYIGIAPMNCDKSTGIGNQPPYCVPICVGLWAQEKPYCSSFFFFNLQTTFFHLYFYDIIACFNSLFLYPES